MAKAPALTALSSLKLRFWPKAGMRRGLKTLSNRLRGSVKRRDLVDGFRMLGLHEGMLLTVHSSMQSFGHVQGGANTVIDALLDVLGGPEKSTVMMPASTMRGSMKLFLEEWRGRTIDLREMPSTLGLLTETFRHWPGAKRSAHPTHSVTVFGKEADALIRDAHASPTPFGPATPFGRANRHEDGHLLLIHCNFGTIMHVAQEQTPGYPTLYEPEHRERVEFIDAEGERRVTETAILSPGINALLLQPPSARVNSGRPYLSLAHWPFPFPQARWRMLEDLEYSRFNKATWLKHREELFDRGIIRQETIGRAGVGLVKAKPCLEFLQADLTRLLAESHEDWTDAVLHECLRHARSLPKR